MILSKKIISSPLGKLVAIASAKGLCVLTYAIEKNKYNKIEELQGTTFSNQFNHTLQETELWLKNYFDKQFKKLKMPTLDLNGSAFALRAWKALCKVPVGKTKSYGELAKAIRHDSAARAIGRVMNQNPIAIIVPCHRIIGANGALTGYAGGLQNKEWLLRHEGYL